METIQTQICTGCKTEKPLNAFAVDKSKAVGHRHRCNECRRNRNATQTIEIPTLDKNTILKRDANRNALLRLIDAHRSQFEHFIYEETSKLQTVKRGTLPRWVSLAPLFEQEKHE